MGRPKKNKVYLAGPWFTPEQKIIHDVAKDIIRNVKGLEYYFPDEHNETARPFTVFADNVNNIKDCSAVIALVDFKDVGTAWEIGMAYQLNKKIYMVGKDENTFKTKTNLMLAFTGFPITIGNLANMLNNNDYNIVDIERKWEIIE